MKFKVPPEHQEIFGNLTKNVRPELRNDENFEKTALVYLALGGKALARHYIEISQADFPDESLLLKHTPLIEPETDSENIDENQDNDNEDDLDES